MMMADWPTTTIGDIFDIGSGKTMSSKVHADAERTPFLRTSNVFWDRIDLSKVDEMPMLRWEREDKSLLPGDLLVCEGGEIGRAAVWEGQVEGVSFQNHLHRLRRKSADVDPGFYAFFLQSAFTQLGIYEGAGNKTTIPNLSRNRLAALEVPKPDYEEQGNIRSVLKRARAAMDLADDSIRVAHELKLAAMRELFTRGMRGEAQKDTEIGPVPESWDVVPLGSLGRIGNGSTPKRSIPSYWAKGTFPWLTSSKVYDREIVTADQFVTETALSECHLPKVQPGAILIAITGQGKTLGHCAVLKIEATTNQHIAYLATDLSRADPSFVRGYIETQYDYLRQVGGGGGSTKGALTCAFLRSLPVPMPSSLGEQQEIAETFDAIDAKIGLHKRKKDVLEELFRAMLYKLMSGEVSVSDLDLSALKPRQEVAA